MPRVSATCETCQSLELPTSSQMADQARPMAVNTYGALLARAREAWHFEGHPTERNGNQFVPKVYLEGDSLMIAAQLRFGVPRGAKWPDDKRPVTKPVRVKTADGYTYMSSCRYYSLAVHS